MVVSCPSAFAAAMRLSMDCCANATFVVTMSATAETLVSFFQVLRIFLPFVLCKAAKARIIAHIKSACHSCVSGYLVDYSVNFQKLYNLARGKCRRADVRRAFLHNGIETMGRQPPGRRLDDPSLWVCLAPKEDRPPTCPKAPISLLRAPLPIRAADRASARAAPIPGRSRRCRTGRPAARADRPAGSRGSTGVSGRRRRAA